MLFFMSFSVKYGKLKIIYTFFSGKTQQKGTEAVITCWLIKSHSHELKIHSINLKKFFGELKFQPTNSNLWQRINEPFSIPDLLELENC